MPRIKLATSDLNLPFVLERRQFLVRLIYSMTINRADRLTLVKLEYSYLPALELWPIIFSNFKSKVIKNICTQICQTRIQDRRSRKCITLNVVYPVV